VADVVAGLYATIGMLAGLLARAKGRSVSHVEAPLLESAMTALVNQAQGYLATGRPPRRLGNEHPSIAPYGPVTTSDGEIIVAVGTDAQYARFVGALGDKGLTERVEFAANDVRVTRRRELGFLINRAMSARTSAQWEEILRRAGVPCAPVLSVPDALAQPQISGGDFVATTTAPGGELRTLGTPLRIDGRRPTVRSGPRAFGEDQELLS
jgi:crotonobetainyl-CoA:carnitine CoA-transferase CaiB-like acyl-CoA transferase